ncbi:hypothetical protein [Variovorax sp. 770b2]|uniref:hypothetical protein n=1 Tax=Variovorax sp. 770b2 TaxID=1566271 RepID=UPI0011604619|nr:hypothetical protein [Variovorax sp. 770b2]
MASNRDALFACAAFTVTHCPASGNSAWRCSAGASHSSSCRHFDRSASIAYFLQLAIHLRSGGEKESRWRVGFSLDISSMDAFDFFPIKKSACGQLIWF